LVFSAVEGRAALPLAARGPDGVADALSEDGGLEVESCDPCCGVACLAVVLVDAPDCRKLQCSFENAQCFSYLGRRLTWLRHRPIRLPFFEA
jgi:hypothetical protein